MTPPPRRLAAAPAPLPSPDEFALAVAAGLTAPRKTLAPRFFYDRLGSALFDAITRLPWYPITRSEKRLLKKRGAEILAAAGDPGEIVELGPGDGGKLALLLKSAPRPRTVHLVDISRAALKSAARRLDRLPGVMALKHEGDYLAALAALPPPAAGAGRLVCFLGSNLGNFDGAAAVEFLRGLRAGMGRGERALVGVDLVKPEEELRLAYDDPPGVTAAFNKNLLARINRELGGEFVLERFAHEARWDAAAARIEMHLVSRVAQAVRIAKPGLTVAFRAGETIWTESSCKYTPARLRTLARAAGFAPAASWTEPRGRFHEALFRAV